MNEVKQYSFLQLILDDRNFHAKFLNTLSFLEYIGARKIFKERDEKSVDLETLVHMSEEVRHALLFKRLSMRVCSRERGYNRGDIFCFEITRRYIGDLDKFCSELVERDDCYALVSYIVEKRAVSFYRYYSHELEKRGGGFSLKSLLMEEERHLAEMGDRVCGNIPVEVMRGALDFERGLFERFVQSLKGELGNSLSVDAR